ncbi:MAG TPA: FtsW/RodA/SpoVE family cell cycle protein [Actinomycetota bacterium]
MQAATTLESRATRGTQLALTILAVILSVGAYVLVVLGKTGKAPPDIVAFVAAMSAAFLIAHFVVVRLAPGADPVLLPTAAVLSGLGYAMIYRLDPGRAGDQFGWLMLGLGLFVLTLFVIRDHRVLDGYTYTIGLAGVAFLLLPVAPGIGRTINGARLWVGVGPLVFEPAEISKVLLVIFLASFLNAKKELLAMATRRIGPLHFPELRYMGPLLVAWAISLAVLFLEKDLGSSLLFFGIFTAMLWTATGRASYLVLGVVLFAIGAFIGYSAFAHVQERVTIYLHALDPQHLHADGYQVAQAQFAMATGGMVGTGLGQGYPDLIPSVWTDFIFAAFGEELGLFGVTALLLLYVALIGRGFRAALAREDGFSKLLGAGLTTAVALQTFIIVGGVTRLIPLTGITLPFVSYGGSSLVANFVLLSLLIRVSAPPPAHAPTRARGRPRATERAESQPTVQTPRGEPA